MQDIAHRAFEQWQNGDFKECLGSLKQIETTLNNDGQDGGTAGDANGVALAKAKLEHNLALMEYVNSGRTPADETALIEKFQDVSRRLEEEVKKNSSSSETSGNSNTNNNNNANSQKRRFQPDASFAIYNQAVVYLMMRKWRSALTMLEDLFRYIDAVDEGLALCICFLLLDVYTLVGRGSGSGDGGLLLGHVVEKAQTVIDYLEKPHHFNGYQDWSSNTEGAKSNNNNSTTRDDEDGEKSHLPKSFTQAQITSVLNRLNTYKMKLVLMQASISSAKKEAKQSIMGLSGDVKDGGDMDDKWKGVSPIPGTKPSVKGMVSCLKANMEYLNGSYEEAYRLLKESMDNGLNHQAIFWNNVGCIHHTLGQHKCASMYFAKALALDRKENHELLAPEISFNLGVQLLHCGHPFMAYECFMKSATKSYHQPRLWLHIAECVVMAHSMKQQQYQDENQDDLIKGDGSKRRIFMLHQNGDSNECNKNLSLPLSVGLRATNHVLFLLNKAETESVVGHSSINNNEAGAGAADMGATSSTSTGGASTPSNVYSKVNGSAIVLESDPEQCKKQAAAMKQTALLCKAYLALAMKNYPPAYQASQQVITASSNMNREYLYIAHGYAAEALLHLSALEMSQKDGLLDHLTQTIAEDNIILNLALVRLSKNQHQEAERLLHKALDILPDSKHTINLLVYLALIKGEYEKARRLLKIKN